MVGKGSCGDCGDLMRRGGYGNYNYYCRIAGRKVKLMKFCPKDEGYVPFVRSKTKLDGRRKLVRVENPCPGVRVDWVWMSV